MKLDDLRAEREGHGYGGSDGKLYTWLNDNEIEDDNVKWLIASFKKLGISPCDNLWDMYQEPQRFYHGIGHVMGCLETAFEIGKPYGYNRDIVFGALAFHDCVYVVGGKHNEYHSSLYAAAKISSQWPYGASADGNWKKAQKANRLSHQRGTLLGAIEGTNGHRYPSTIEAALVYDCDLWGLGSDPSEFEKNTDNILREYLTVYDLPQVKAGRIQWIDEFLKRDKIYYTAFGAEREEQARSNLTRERNLFQASLA